MVTNTIKKRKKKQTNWRIFEDIDQGLEKDRVDKGFSSIPALVNYILTRYLNNETVKK